MHGGFGSVLFTFALHTFSWEQSSGVDLPELGEREATPSWSESLNNGGQQRTQALMRRGNSYDSSEVRRAVHDLGSITRHSPAPKATYDGPGDRQPSSVLIPPQKENAIVHAPHGRAHAISATKLASPSLPASAIEKDVAVLDKDVAETNMTSFGLLLGVRVCCVCACLILFISAIMVSAPAKVSMPLNVLAFMLCSGTMVVINKLAVAVIPVPALLVAVQFAFCALVMRTLGLLGLADVQALEWDLVKKFGPVAATEVARVLLNMKALQHANVDTMILFRSSLPLFTVVFDHKIFGRDLPDRVSILALLGTCLGICAYIKIEKSSISFQAYGWILAWLLMLLFDGIYVRLTMDKIPMSTSTRVYYVSTLGTLPCLLLSLTDARAIVHDVAWLSSTTPCLLLFSSCIVGVALSYFNFQLRAFISVTAYLLMGHVCKILSIILNVSVWANHATPAGICAVISSLVCAAMYRDAPEHGKVEKGSPESAAGPAGDMLAAVKSVMRARQAPDKSRDGADSVK